MAEYTLTNADLIHGGHLMLLMDNEPIAFATNHQLNKTLNTQSISCKDMGDNETVLPQSKSYEITTSNLYSLNGYHKLNAAFEGMKTVGVYFGETTYNNAGQASIVGGATGLGAQNWAATGFGESGIGYITSLNVVAGSGETATFEATIQVSGGLTPVGAPTGIYGPAGTNG